jgi:hypothetical protein
VNEAIYGYSSDLKSQNIKNQRTVQGQVGVLHLNHYFTQAWLKLVWESCDKDRHGADSFHKSQSLHNKLSKRSPSYTSTTQKSTKRHIYSDLIKQDTNYLRQWIKTNQPGNQGAISKSAKVAKTNAILNV